MHMCSFYDYDSLTTSNEKTRFSSNSEAVASEVLENLEETFTWTVSFFYPARYSALGPSMVNQRCIAY